MNDAVFHRVQNIEGEVKKKILESDREQNDQADDTQGGHRCQRIDLLEEQLTDGFHHGIIGRLCEPTIIAVEDQIEKRGQHPKGNDREQNGQQDADQVAQDGACLVLQVMKDAGVGSHATGIATK